MFLTAIYNSRNLIGSSNRTQSTSFSFNLQQQKFNRKFKLSAKMVLDANLQQQKFNRKFKPFTPPRHFGIYNSRNLIGSSNVVFRSATYDLQQQKFNRKFKRKWNLSRLIIYNSRNLIGSSNPYICTTVRCVTVFRIYYG